MKKSEEIASEIQSIPQWSIGAPEPQVFSNGHTTFLIYGLAEDEPIIADEVSETGDDNNAEPLALIEFTRGYTFRFGIANDEIHWGLPYNKGYSGHSAHIVGNSEWIAELQAKHKIHPQYDENRWTEKKHFAFLFKGSLFEVIATGYKVEKHRTTVKKLSMKVAERMNSF